MMVLKLNWINKASIILPPPEITSLPLSKKEILAHPVYCLAFGLGSGFAPKAPGTFGTLLAIPLFIVMAYWPIQLYVLAVFALAGAGIYLCGETARVLHVHDHPGIVWDEVVGFLITMVALPNDWRAILLGFVLFRLFDILKPWPIGMIDRLVKGGFGIMLDDIIAGILAAVVGSLLWHYAIHFQSLLF